MIVYDIVQHVAPGAQTSTPAGRWYVGHRDTEYDALRDCERYNNCVSIPGIRYSVEAHDEESTERAATP